jgi:hypothetical protein
MKLAVIPPLDALELTEIGGGDYHLILPQLAVDHPDYVKFFQDQRGYKILDNGA